MQSLAEVRVERRRRNRDRTQDDADEEGDLAGECGAAPLAGVVQRAKMQELTTTRILLRCVFRPGRQARDECEVYTD